MSDWKPVPTLPDLRHVDTIALDTETKDGGLLTDRGSSWPWGDGYICGVSVAYRAEGTIRAHYFPIRHPDSPNFDPAQVFAWVRDHIAAGVKIVTQNGLYDYGWLRTDGGILMPPSDLIEEIGALATMVDENRKRYSLDALCAWRGLPGKDETLLKEAATAAGFPKRTKVQAYIHKLPARIVGPYAETDAVRTLEIFESLNPIIDAEGTRAAYRLECDLLPMVHEMRRRGIRIDGSAAEQRRDLLLGMRDAVLAEISEKLGTNIGMDELNSAKWRAAVFDQNKIVYPRTEKGNPSFTAGNSGWMPKHPHWLPRSIVKTDRLHNYGENFLGTYILGHTINGRVHAEIHPHRGDDGSGTRSMRFSYSSPPLQLMPRHDEQLAPLIRGVFLPEEGEVWAVCDVSQQEFRMIVHYAARHKLSKAAEAAELYRNNPKTDFHLLVSSWTGRDRQTSKNTNFAKVYGAGVRKFASMISKSETEAATIYEQYDRELPFAAELATMCERAVRRNGYLTLYSTARRHWTDWAPGGKWKKGLGPCPREEAEARATDPNHPWFQKQLWRANCRLAMNALIQGSSAAHTKLWMRECWREGFVPLLQMHDALELSVSSPEQAERVAELGCAAVKLEVPMIVDIAYGRNWGDAKHSWEDLQKGVPSKSLENFGLSHETATATPEPILESDFEDEDDVEDEIPATETDWAAALDRDFPRATATSSTAMDTTPPPPPPTSTPPPPTSTPRYGGNGSRGGNGFDTYSRGEDEVPPASGASARTSSAEYIYKDPHGTFYMKVVRTTAKTFPTYHIENGNWVKGWPKEVVPYRLPELLAALASEPVWICEGEKDANNVATLGLIATCNPGGAKQWQPELTQYFKGKELVYILEDNDEDGRKHTGLIIRALRPIVAAIAVISFPELPVKGDVSDWLEQGGNLKLLRARAEQARLRSSTRSYVTINLATSPKRAYNWIWSGHLVRGNLELLTGIPSIGKSQIHCQYVAIVTTGRHWPDGAPGIIPCRVLMLTAEDNTIDTLGPRLTAAGADLRLVEELKWVRRNDRDEMFLLAEDLDKLEEAIRDNDVGLVTIDPITSYMGGGGKNFDSHKATDVRSQLSPLKLLAERTGVAFSAITHPPKNASQRALDHFIGSQAFVAACRIGHVCFPEMELDPNGHKHETGRGLFTNPKPLGPKQPTLAYRIVVADAGLDTDTGLPLTAPVICWEGVVDITADQANAATRGSKAVPPDPKEFLLTILTNGSVLQSKIIERGQQCGFSEDQLKRAKDKLNIKSIKTGGSGSPWMWALPEDVPEGTETKKED